MRKRVGRTLKELYGVTDKITEPEITPVLEGNCRIQGPVDESDHELCMTNSGTFPAAKEFEFINKSFHMRVESGTCNVCSAPCSSCMHNNRTLLNMESKIKCRSSHNSCEAKEADGCSFICVDGMPLNKSRICDDLQPAASEVSNLLSASSSHGSYSENAESKATVRTSATCESSEDINMPHFLPLRETVEYQFLQEKSLFSPDSHITSALYHRISSKRDEEQQGLGCHGDNISCITGVKDSNIKLGHHNFDLDNKIATCSSTSTDILLSGEVENKVQGETIDCVHASGNENRQGNYRRQVTCPEESFLQKKCADSANTAFSDKPDLAEVHLPNHSSSPKVQCRCFPSHNGNAICHNGNCEVSVGSVSFQPHIDGEASSGPQIAVDNKLDGKKPPANNGNSKASDTGTHAVKITDPCLENENGSDMGISSDEVIKSGIINMQLKIPSSLVEASDMQEPQLVMEGGNSESEPELTDVKVCDICGDAGREELLAFCSKCSDGAEHTYCMLVMLRKVPEGDWLCEECQLKENAERKKMDRPEKLSGTVKQCKPKEEDEARKVDRSEKVSGIEKECKFKEDDKVKKMDRYEKVSGIAKECKLKVHAEVKKGEISEAVSRAAKECKQDTENKEVDKSETLPGTSKLTCLTETKEVDMSETLPGTSKLTCLTETRQKLASKSNLKLMPKLDLNVIDPEVRRMPKGLHSPRISAKRHAYSQDVTSSNSKKPAEISGECVETSIPRKKTALSCNSSFKNLDTEKTRVVNMPPSNGSQDVASSNSKKPAEISGECVEMGSPRNIPALLRDSSFKNLDTGKTMVVNMTSSTGRQSANSSKGFSRSQSMLGSHVSKVQAQLQPPHGFLSRSSSFNNSNLKPKVKQLTQNVLIKPKITRGSSLNDTRKVEVVRSITKSASLKNIGSGRSNTESASKTQFIHQPYVEEPRSFKQVKEKTMMEKKISFTLDRPPTSLSPRSGTSTPLPKMDMKIAIHNVKLNNMSESNIPRINKGSDNANGVGRNDTKMQSKNSAKTVSASLNASSSENQRPCQTPKERARGCSSSTEKLYNNFETVQHRGVFQTSESTHQDDKTKDPTVFSSSKQVVSGGNRTLHCQRCNETGHATQFCSVDKLESSALKPASDNNSKDGNKKGNKWKTAVETTILKSRLQKNNRQMNQSEEFPASSANPSSEVASKDFLPTSSIHPRNIPLVVGTDGQEEILRSSDVDPIKTSRITDVGQLPSVEDSSTSRTPQTIEASCTPKPSKLNASDSVSDELNKKHLRHMLPDQALELAQPCRISAIPKLEFIWQGSLEVLTTGNEPAPFDGIQAHLSTSASPKVLDVASKLPCKVRLEEVSWINSWPLQFQGISPDENNIALFFFAKNIESYEMSYSKLLEKMLKNDLALRGLIDSVELLIFPSTKLPVHSQRWNRLFFLWGIFKGRTDNLTPKLSSHKQPSGGPILNIDLETQDLPCALSSVVFDSQRLDSVDNPENGSPKSDIPKPKALISSTWVELRATSSPKVEDRMCRVQDSPVVHNSTFPSAAYSMLPSQQSSCSLPESHFLSSTNQLSNVYNAQHPESRFQMANTSPCSEVKSDDAYPKNLDLGGRHVVTTSDHIPEIIEQIGLRRASPSLSTSSDCRKDQWTDRESSLKGPIEEEISMKNEAVFYDDPLHGDLKGIEGLSWEKSNRKRARLCCTEAVSKASGETTKCSGETMLWRDKVNYLPMCLTTDDERERKRMCFSEVHAGYSFTEETSSVWKSSKAHSLFGSFLNEQHSESRYGNSEVLVPDSSTRQSERFFFPVQPSPVQNTQSDSLVHILSSDDEDASESNSPDLELALGGKQRAQKKPQWKEPVEDDISASLSLSLAIPTPKEEWQKPILKSEHHLQDSSDVNTALLLFGGWL